MIKRTYQICIMSVALLFSRCIFFQASPAKMTRLALKANKQYDAIIIPGIQFVPPQWDRVLQMRLIWARHLYDRGLAKNIITSGSSVYTPYVEGEIMKACLVAMGVPAEHVFVERKAEHSVENLWYGHLLARSLGFKRVAFASDPFQSKLLYRFAKKRTRREVKFLPVNIDTLRTLPHDMPVIDFKSLLVDSFVPITEKYSKRQRFRGTMGRNIDFKAKH